MVSINKTFVQRLTFLLINAVMAAPTRTKSREMSKEYSLRNRLKKTNLRIRRELSQTEVFDIPLFLELQFLREGIAEQLELHNDTSAAVLDLCRCIQEQVRCCWLDLSHRFLR